MVAFVLFDVGCEGIPAICNLLFPPPLLLTDMLMELRLAAVPLIDFKVVGLLIYYLDGLSFN